MHQTRNEIIRGLPLARKGSKYVAYASRNNSNAVPVIIAIRDMLKIASNSKEGKYMIHNKLLKINGQLVTELNQPINLFSIFYADKNYQLVILPTGRFAFEDTKENSRPVRVIGKNAVKDKKIQYGLHDGTSLISKEKINVGDTVFLDFDNKIKKHIAFEKGKNGLVISGKNIGKTGKIIEVLGKNVNLLIKGQTEEVVLQKAQIMIQ
ncbi:hypothetical protein EXS72_00455 [Candidatus Pacearchaeota archaeon]|nr:hypothetical protein [Candidatus Pacearchaeota archaeon]